MSTGPTAIDAFARAVEEGEARWWLGSLATIKATARDTAGRTAGVA